MTPEGKIKAMVRKGLKELGDACWYFMPVQSGYGRPALDIMGYVNGHGFAIETKAPGGRVTPRQQLTIAALREAGVLVFIVDSGEACLGAIGVLSLLKVIPLDMPRS